MLRVTRCEYLPRCGSGSSLHIDRAMLCMAHLCLSATQGIRDSCFTPVKLFTYFCSVVIDKVKKYEATRVFARVGCARVGACTSPVVRTRRRRSPSRAHPPVVVSKPARHQHTTPRARNVVTRHDATKSRLRCVQALFVSLACGGDTRCMHPHPVADTARGSYPPPACQQPVACVGAVFHEKNMRSPCFNCTALNTG